MGPEDAPGHSGDRAMSCKCNSYTTPQVRCRAGAGHGHSWCDADSTEPPSPGLWAALPAPTCGQAPGIHSGTTSPVEKHFPGPLESTFHCLSPMDGSGSPYFSPLDSLPTRLLLTRRVCSLVLQAASLLDGVTVSACPWMDHAHAQQALEGQSPVRLQNCLRASRRLGFPVGVWMRCALCPSGGVTGGRTRPAQQRVVRTAPVSPRFPCFLTASSFLILTWVYQIYVFGVPCILTFKPPVLLI